MSDEIAKLNVGSDAPYRMALHPSGKALIMGLTLGGLKRANIMLPPSTTTNADTPPPEVTLAGPEFDEKGSKFGVIKALSFSSDGKTLALGGEDGTIELVSWPSMDSLRAWKASEKSIRNIDFSTAHADGVVSSVDESGTCVLWDVATGTAVATLAPPPTSPEPPSSDVNQQWMKKGLRCTRQLNLREKGMWCGGGSGRMGSW